MMNSFTSKKIPFLCLSIGKVSIGFLFPRITLVFMNGPMRTCVQIRLFDSFTSSATHNRLQSIREVRDGVTLPNSERH